MRGFALLALTGCGSTAPAAPPVAAPSPSDAPHTEPFVRSARIEVSRTPGHEGWIDIELRGDEYRAEQLCQWQLDQHERIQHLRPDARVVQACSATPLSSPVPRPGTVVLVDVHELSERDFSPQILLAPAPTPWETGEPATGAITSRQRFPDLASCRQALDQLARTRAAADAEMNESIHRVLTEELARARDTQTRACGESRARVSECARRSERAGCDFDVEVSTRACNNARARIQALEKRLSMASPAPTRLSPVCRLE